MLPQDPIEIKEELEAERIVLADAQVSEIRRIDACRQLRRLIMGMYVQVVPELSSRNELSAMLIEAEQGIRVMEEHRTMVEKEAAKNHRAGTTADDLIRLCKRYIFDVRQRAELFAIQDPAGRNPGSK